MRSAILFLFFFCIFLLQSCTERCTCYKQKCSLFNNDSLRICQDSYGDLNRYMSARDSLYRKYGSLHDTVYGPVDVSGESSPVNSVINQLQTQGYTCECYNFK